VDEALALEDQLLRQARRTPGGAVIWLDPRSLRGTGARPASLGPHLYDGVMGVAFFLAALDRVAGTEERRDFILPALAPWRQQRERWGRQVEPRFSLGGFNGLGGLVYGFLQIGRWLSEPELAEEAADLASLLTPDRIGADDALDVMGGCAGAALGLLALDRALPGPVQGWTPAERAVACGEHLLACRASLDGGPRAWPARGGRPPRCGFAHGAAGIAFCLARLFERTGDRRFLEAAEEGVAFEHLYYHPEHGNWPSPGATGPCFVSAWCSGAPGVALGRLGMLGRGADDAARQDLQAALETTLASSKLTGDSLCCGNPGRAEILLRAYEVLGEERFLRGAQDLASRMVARSREQDGRYGWFGPGDHRFAPALFTGAAGVGYTLLRLARPSFLPCVLALEAD
jgi:lantibiotic modifying enzyme